jgi:hypothetical protein
MKNYHVRIVGLILAIATFVSIGCSSTKAKNRAEEQSTTGSSQSQSTTGSSQSSTDQTAASTAGNETLEGCVFKRETDLYVEPISGGPAKKVSSSGKDVSSNVGQHVNLTGSTQAPSQGSSPTGTSGSTGTSGGSMAGSSSSNEPEFVVTRVDVAAKECPADVQSKIDQEKKSKKQQDMK